MPRGFDHIVHAVRDLDAAADLYARAGFLVGTRNKHPWGTHNRIVQLQNGYIEILEVAEPEKIPPHAAKSFSFGAFHHDYLDAHEGFATLLLNSRDAAADARAFETAGIGGVEVFEFAREGARPDGTRTKLAFSLVFARDKTSPDAAFAVCQHHFPENFWNPAFQVHANGARRVCGVTLVADNPADHHAFLKSFTGVSDLQSGSMGITAVTENGDVAIITPAAFRDQFGVASKPDGEGMTLNALRFEVGDLAEVEALHQSSGVASHRQGDRLVAPPHVAHGATLIFETAGQY